MVIERFRGACVLAAVLLVGTAAAARGECNKVHFVTGQNYIGAPASRGVATVSVRPDEISVTNLLCLAQGLRARYPEWRRVAVLFFASPEAAKRWTPERQLVDYVGPPPPFWKWEADMRAGYFLDAEKGEEYLLLTPFGWNAGRDELATRIDLPLAGPPGCIMALGNRCLMAWDRFDYPADATAGAPSGSVIV